MKQAIRSHMFAVILLLVTGMVVAIEATNLHPEDKEKQQPGEPVDSTWLAPSLYTDQLPTGKARAMIIYGQDLIANTAKYLGPRGSVLQITNGMNCQNCHLDAGTRPWGNNYSGVSSTYPKFRARSGTTENIYKRVNDCIERSLNGQVLDTASYEMQSIYAYMQWLGQGVPKGRKPHGAGLPTLPFMDRAADPGKGKAVYSNTCQSCHGQNGDGILDADGRTYVYPPLWGDRSYSDGAGLYRITRFASFVKNNMPFNQATFHQPILTDEEAWDVAAFVNTQPRPHKEQSADWSDISKKSLDEPFGPYKDGFSERQHKYGPYQEIEKASRTNTDYNHIQQSNKQR